MVAELRQRARDCLADPDDRLRRGSSRNIVPSRIFWISKAMTESIAFRLAEQGIRTRDDLAECAVDELEEVKGLEPETWRRELIMKARAHWFTEE